MQLQDSCKSSELTAVEAIQTWLVNQIAKQLSVPAQSIQVEEPLTRYGLDSIDSVTIVGELEDWLETELPSTLLWDYPTIGKAARYLVDEVGVTPVAETEAAAEAPAAEAAPAGKGWGGIFGRGR